MIKIVSIVGARPQFIKAAPLSRAFANSEINELIVHTGQHFDEMMSDVFFSELEIPTPAYSLEINSLSHGALTGRMIEGLEKVFLDENPDGVVVYGDTNSTLAGAIAAVKLHIPVFHIESGLRSFNRKMPEEINRILTDQCSELLFTPTDLATRNLVREGFSESLIHQVGDIMYDVALHFSKLAEKKGTILPFGLSANSYILATVHRQENTDDENKLKNILLALNKLAQEIEIVLPLHPRTKNKIGAFGLDHLLGSLRGTEPLGYLEMLMLEKNATLIATDSGGVQKEAYFWDVPCVTMRDETEWVELVDAGWNRLALPASADDIVVKVKSSIGTKGEQGALYGDGDSAEKIVRIIEQYLASRA